MLKGTDLGPVFFNFHDLDQKVNSKFIKLADYKRE